MIPLFAVNLIRTVFIIVVIWFLFRVIKGLLQANAAQRAAAQNLAQQLNNERRAQDRRNRTVSDNGDVRVEYRDGRRNGRNSADDGEYVDFEEVD